MMNITINLYTWHHLIHSISFECRQSLYLLLIKIVVSLVKLLRVDALNHKLALVIALSVLLWQKPCHLEYLWINLLNQQITHLFSFFSLLYHLLKSLSDLNEVWVAMLEVYGADIWYFIVSFGLHLFLFFSGLHLYLLLLDQIFRRYHVVFRRNFAILALNLFFLEELKSKMPASLLVDFVKRRLCSHVQYFKLVLFKDFTGYRIDEHEFSQHVSHVELVTKLIATVFK